MPSGVQIPCRMSSAITNSSTYSRLSRPLASSRRSRSSCSLAPRRERGVSRLAFALTAVRRRGRGHQDSALPSANARTNPFATGRKGPRLITPPLAFLLEAQETTPLRSPIDEATNASAVERGIEVEAVCERAAARRVRAVTVGCTRSVYLRVRRSLVPRTRGCCAPRVRPRTRLGRSSSNGRAPAAVGSARS
jgi:hypothetical protein